MTQVFPEQRAHLARMEQAGLPRRFIEEFLERYRSYRAGATGKLAWSEIGRPQPGDIVDLVADDGQAERGSQLLDRLVCIKCNGGLGTTMKLAGPKSLIPVREGKTFLQLVREQTERLQRRHGARMPLMLMNSYVTRQASLAALAGYQQPGDLPLDFVQHRAPRIVRDSGLPLALADEEQNWCPPGHGDIYLALLLCGLLERLVRAGYRWAFVSNVDNLGATVDPGLLGLLEQQGCEFAMEVTDKTRADIKGGTLVRHGGRLTLLERAQVDDDHLADFEDVEAFSVFNTNSLWWRLDAMLARLRAGRLDLPLIVNPKTVAGQAVVQLEIAMGAAVACFEGAIGVRVPRRRFAPVKATVDLLALRSDAYTIDEDAGVRPSGARAAELGPPLIKLEPRFYQGIDDLELRVPHPLRLTRCRSLTVEGDIRFGRDVEIVGDVILRNDGEAPATIDDGARFEDGSHEIS